MEADGVADLCLLDSISEEAVLAVLKDRFNRDLIYTYCGTVLLAVNPYKPLTCYGKREMRQYSSHKLTAPHIYATAENALENLRLTGQSQSIVISGESGAGKTESTKLILEHVTFSSLNPAWIEQQILEANTILEAFGNAKTARNNNSSRFGKFTQVCFSADHDLLGAVVEDYLLEKSRVVKQGSGERNFHIFYQICSASDDWRALYSLQTTSFYRYTNQSGVMWVDGINDKSDFDALRRALTVLHFSLEAQKEIFRTLSAILLLGNLIYEGGPDEATSLNDQDKIIISELAFLLQIDKKALAKALMSRRIETVYDSCEINLSLEETRKHTDAVAKELYARIFRWVLDCINLKTNPGGDVARQVGVLDIYGFENFDSHNSFEQLCINFTNEKLHRFFNESCFESMQGLYKSEGITFDAFAWEDNQGRLDLVEKAPHCILSLLNAACTMSSTEDNYLQEMHSSLGKSEYYMVPKNPRQAMRQFGVRHYAGEVLYTVAGFMQKNVDSRKDLLEEALHSSRLRLLQGMSKLIKPGDEATNRRQSRRVLSISEKYKQQLENLMATLRDSSCAFVKCFKPNEHHQGDRFTEHLMSKQLLYSGISDVIDIMKRGFPHKLPHDGFIRRYRCLAVGLALDPSTTGDEQCRVLLDALQTDPAGSSCQLGKTRIFLSQAEQDSLEAARRSARAQAAVACQRVWRGYKERVRFTHLRAVTVFVQRCFLRTMEQRRFRRTLVAVIKIQARYRGHLARKRYYQLLRLKNQKLLQKRQKKLKQLRACPSQVNLQISKAEDVAKTSAVMANEREDGLRSAQAQMDNAGVDMQREDALLVEALQMLEAAVTEDDRDDCLSAVNASRQRLDAASLAFQEQQDNYQAALAASRKAQVQSASAQQQLLNVERALVANNKKEDGARGGDEDDFAIVKGADKKLQLVSRKASHRVIPGDPTFMKFASKHCNRHYDSKRVPVDPAELVSYSTAKSIPRSLTKMDDKALEKVAVQLWKGIQSFLNSKEASDRSDSKRFAFVEQLLATGINEPLLRDEIYLQVCRQLNNQAKPSTKKQKAKPPPKKQAWLLLDILTTSFPPSGALYKDVNAFLRHSLTTGAFAKVGETCARCTPEVCLAQLKSLKLNGVRHSPMSRAEYECLCSNEPLPMVVHFLGRVCVTTPTGESERISKLVIGGDLEQYNGICSKTFSEFASMAAEDIYLTHPAGWSLFELDNGVERCIRGTQYVGDIIRAWEDKYQAPERNKRRRESIDLLSPSRPYPELFFKCRLFRREPGYDVTSPESLVSVENSLLYEQAVHGVRSGSLPVQLRTALHLAGLQARINKGPFDPSVLVSEQHYGELESYLPAHIIANKNRASKRTRKDWVFLIAKRHREIGDFFSETAEAKGEYLRVIRTCDQYYCSYSLVSYVGHWSLPNVIRIGVDENGFRFAHRTTNADLRVFSWSDLEQVRVDSSLELSKASGRHTSACPARLTLTLERPPDPQHITGKREEQIEFVFETDEATQVASMIASYSPNWKHAAWSRSTDADNNLKQVKVSNTQRIAVLRMLRRCRLKLVNEEIVKIPTEQKTRRRSSLGFGTIRSFAPTLKRLKALQSSFAVIDEESDTHGEEHGEVGAMSLREMEMRLPAEFWGFTKGRIPEPVMDMRCAGAWEHVDTAHRLFTSILIFSGLAQSGGYQVDNDPSHTRMVQACVQACYDSDELGNEFFLQLIKQTTDHPRPNSQQNLMAWKLMCMTLACLVPTNPLVLSYLRVHLELRSIEDQSEQGRFATFALKLLSRRLLYPRQHPPSETEQWFTAQRQRIFVRVHFLGGGSQAFLVDPWSSVKDLLQEILLKLGLPRSCRTYGLFESNAQDKTTHELNLKAIVADTLFKWEKLVESNSKLGGSTVDGDLTLVFRTSHRTTLQGLPDNKVEERLFQKQAIYDIRMGLYPLTEETSRLFGALLCQIDLGDYNCLQVEHVYLECLEKYFPEQLDNELIDDVVAMHETLKGTSRDEAGVVLLRQFMKWPFCGSTLYNVQQTYKQQWPQDLWLVVHASGIGLFAKNNPVPLKFYLYAEIISFSPGAKHVMIVTGSAHNGTKYVFNTSQAELIVQMMRHFTTDSRKRPVSIVSMTSAEDHPVLASMSADAKARCKPVAVYKKPASKQPRQEEEGALGGALRRSRSQYAQRKRTSSKTLLMDRRRSSTDMLQAVRTECDLAEKQSHLVRMKSITELRGEGKAMPAVLEDFAATQTAARESRKAETAAASFEADTKYELVEARELVANQRDELPQSSFVSKSKLEEVFAAAERQEKADAGASEAGRAPAPPPRPSRHISLSEDADDCRYEDIDGDGEQDELVDEGDVSPYLDPVTGSAKSPTSPRRGRGKKPTVSSLAVAAGEGESDSDEDEANIAPYEYLDPDKEPIVPRRRRKAPAAPSG